MPVARMRAWWYLVFGKELFSDCSVLVKSWARNQRYLQLWSGAA